MKLDRLGVALIVTFALGGSVYVHGIEKTAYAAFVALSGLWLYSAIIRTMHVR